MSRRKAAIQEGIPQCTAYFDMPPGKVGPYDCYRFPCCWEKGHDGPHENDLSPWPNAEDMTKGFTVFDPNKHEHYCSSCKQNYTCNALLCAAPLQCEKCKGATE